MSKIFDNLWIGGVEDVYNPIFIKSVLPTHIINCTVNERMYYGEFICKRNRIELCDDDTDDLNKFINGAKILDEYLNEKDSRVIVHCAAGMSRSVTLVLTWMIMYKKYTFDQAYDYVAEKRSIMRPNKYYINFLKNMYFE